MKYARTNHSNRSLQSRAGRPFRCVDLFHLSPMNNRSIGSSEIDRQIAVAQQLMDLNHRLMSAAEKGDDLAFKRLLCVDVEVDLQQEKLAWNEMHAVSKLRSHELKDFLFQASSFAEEFGHLDHGNKTLHHHVMEFSGRDLMRSLITLGFNPNGQNPRGETPLMLAAEARQPDLCDVLLASGARPNVACGDLRQTPLHSAATMGDTAICRALIEAGADPSAQDALNRAPLHFAAEGGHVDVIRLLAEHPSVLQNDLNRIVLNFHSPLYNAVSSAKDNKPQALEALKLLLDLGADIQKSKGLLHTAAHMGHLGAARVLIEAGADVQAPDDHGQTPLHFAALPILTSRTASAQKVEIAGILLSRGAPVDPLNFQVRTPLHIAAEEGSLDMCLLLMKAGADPLRKLRGVTAAGAAGRNKRPEVSAQIKAFVQSQKAAQAIDNALKSAHPNPKSM